MMLEHATIWTADLEKMQDFYAFYFGGYPQQ